MTDTYPISDATRLKRHPERGNHDRACVHAILDEALVCHLAFAAGAHVMAIPTVFARRGETVYVHGARANRSLDALAEGAPFSITVTLVDGLVFARSAFHHSMNYRSVVLTGTAREVTDREEKLAAMAGLIDKLSAGRHASLRPMHDWELDTTRLIAVEIEHASAKIRSGGPVESIDDVSHPVWGGVVPLRLVAGVPEPDEHVRDTTSPEIPSCLVAPTPSVAERRDRGSASDA